MSYNRRVSIKKNAGAFMLILITFMYAFFFKFVNVSIISAIDSTLILGFLLIMPFCISHKMQRNFFYIIQNKKFQCLFIGCIFLLVSAALIILLHGAKDFSILEPLFHQLLFIIVGVEYFAYMESKQKEGDILKYFVIAYCIQTVIQCLAFLSPAFHRVTNWFKTAEEISLQKYYDGFRLNGISGSIAFGLAAGYAIVTALYIIRWDEFKQWNKLKKIMILVLLMAGGLLAGRTAILLDVIVLFCAMVKRIKTGKRTIKIDSSVEWILILIPIILIAVIVIPLYLSKMGPEFMNKLGTFRYWLVKWKYDYFGIGESTGMNFFEDMMEKMPPLSTLLLGDGMYMTPDGANYLGQDAGYIRILAFGGVYWLTVLFVYQKMFLSKRRKFEAFVIMLIILIGTIKADFLGMLLQSQLILIQMFLYNLGVNKRSGK